MTSSPPPDLALGLPHDVLVELLARAHLEADTAHRRPPGLLLGLPNDVLVNLLVRLEARDLGSLAATCRLLQYGQSPLPQTPNPVEDALRLRTQLNGWSGTLPVGARGAVKYFLRLAWQHELEFHLISASRTGPVSLFVDSGGSLRASGVEVQRNEDTGIFLDEHYGVAYAGSLGFGPDWHTESGSDYLRKEEPTLVPATEGVRMRSVAVGDDHCLALDDEGQVYIWGPIYETLRPPKVPTLFEEIEDLKVRQVSVGMFHSAALTGKGKLYTWLHDKRAWQDGRVAAGAGYPVSGLGFVENDLCRPKCVEALAGMRIVSVAAGYQFTIVVIDNGMTFL
jgi:hypothetical protein